MDEKLIQAILAFRKKHISNEELIALLPFSPDDASEAIPRMVDEIIVRKDRGDVEAVLTLIDLFENEDKFPDQLHKLLLEPWHSSYEEIIHMLQYRMDPASVPFINDAIHKKYEYLESYGTGTCQFIGQCGHALWSIGTAEAFGVIRELAEKSQDPMVRVEMTYRLWRIGTDDGSINSPRPKRWWELSP